MEVIEDLSNRTCLVVDNGIFLPFSQRLARDFGRVLYFSFWERGFNVLRENVIGDGLGDVERCEDIWPEIDAGNVDVVAFPDCGNSGLQLHLEAMGIPVFGSRTADRIETDRELFYSMQKQFGLPQSKYQVVVGMDNLRAYLKDHERVYIKWSKTRGDCETRRHINYTLSEQWLDEFESAMSPFKNIVRFVCQKELVTDLEIGIDFPITVDGEFPSQVLTAIEIKDEGAFSCLRDYSDLSEQLTSGIEAFRPFLKECRARTMLSTEVRIKDDVGYFTDPTMRMASPCGEPALEMVSNFSECVWAAAHGELVQPEFEAQYACQAMIRHKGDADSWRAIQVPEEAERWTKLYRACFLNDSYFIAPVTPQFDEIGSVIGIGDTVEEAVEALKEHIEILKDNPIECDTDALYDAIEQAKSAQGQDVPVSDSRLPNPSIAL